MECRYATDRDLDRIAAMNHALIEDEGHRNPMGLSALRDRLAGWFVDQYRAVLFEREREIAGYALYRPYSDWIYLRQFFVKPECRRQGVGRTGLAWLEANAWGGQRVRLDVLIDNQRALAFWRAVGFADYSVTMERDLSPIKR